jgi:hypothetical protein
MCFRGLGFDLKLFGSQKHVIGKLQSQSAERLAELKKIFVRNDHPRFKREFAANRHVPYGLISGLRGRCAKR